MKKIILLILMLSPLLIFSQKLELQKLRELYCVKNCGKYKRKMLMYNVGSPPDEFTYSKFKRIFSIPLEKRNEIYPFNKYDSAEKSKNAEKIMSAIRKIIG